jgi:hypothetical protein
VGKRDNVIEIRQNNFDEMLKLLPIVIQGVQLEKSGIPDESKMKSRSAKRLQPRPLGCTFFVLAQGNPIYQQPEILSLDEQQEMIPPTLQVYMDCFI